MTEFWVEQTRGRLLLGVRLGHGGIPGRVQLGVAGGVRVVDPEAVEQTGQRRQRLPGIGLTTASPECLTASIGATLMFTNRTPASWNAVRLAVVKSE